MRGLVIHQALLPVAGFAEAGREPVPDGCRPVPMVLMTSSDRNIETAPDHIRNCKANGSLMWNSENKTCPHGG